VRPVNNAIRLLRAYFVRVAVCQVLISPFSLNALELGKLEASTWTPCAQEGSFCAFEGKRVARYGVEGSWHYAVSTNGIACTNASFGDPAFGHPKSCDLGEPSSGYVQGGRVGVLPIFYVFSNVPEEKMPTDIDKAMLKQYLVNARAQFASMLDLSLDQSFEVHEPLIHRGVYSESHISNPPRLKPGTDTDLEHAIVQELLQRRKKTRVTENDIYLFIMVREKIFNKFPRRFAGGRSFNGGINGGGGLVVLEYAEMQLGFYGVLVHELGHAFGLTHVDCYGQSMKTSPSIMSYNLKHRARGIDQGKTPGGLLPEEKALLLLNKRVFPNRQDIKKLQNNASACVLPAMDPALGPLPTIRGVGYDLLINNRMVSGPDALFFTKKQAERHCRDMMTRHAARDVECRYAGTTFNQRKRLRPGS
jgi:hypothetical protein